MNDDEPAATLTPAAIRTLALARSIVADAASNAGASFGGMRDA